MQHLLTYFLAIRIENRLAICQILQLSDTMKHIFWKESMFTIKPISFEESRRIAHDHGMTLPIEQAQEWVQYQNTIPGRKQWGGGVLNLQR